MVSYHTCFSNFHTARLEKKLLKIATYGGKTAWSEGAMCHEIMLSILDNESKRLKTTGEQRHSARGSEEGPGRVLNITRLHAGEI